jgi:hypothetical protein
MTKPYRKTVLFEMEIWKIIKKWWADKVNATLERLNAMG